jgi:hypothetical protein
MRVLIACEESQTVCKAFRALGHEAYSCDIQECSGGHPEWHIIGDAITEAYSGKYDLMIAHPPCTYMSKAGARWMYPTAGNISKERLLLAIQAKEFFMELLNAPIERISIENPVPLKIVGLPLHSQFIEPFQFGEPFSKKTLLWNKGLPSLKPTKIISNYTTYLPSNTGGKKRGEKYNYVSISQKDSSKTFQGIANAMAEQWGNSKLMPLINKQLQLF